MIWVVESEVFDATYDERMTKAAHALGSRLVHWDDAWLGAGLPRFDGPVVFHGSLGNAHALHVRGAWKPGAFCATEAFHCSAWYPRADKWLLGMQTPTPARPEAPESPARATSGLYGGSSVPTVRASRPRAAAVQLNTTGTGGRVVGADDDIEPIEIGAAEDDEEFQEPAEGGFSVTVHEEDYDDAFLPDVEGDEGDLSLIRDLEEVPSEDASGISESEVAALYAEAETAVADGDLNAAADLFSDVIDADPDHRSAHVARGRVFLDLGDYSRAMSDFTVSEELAPDDPEPQVAIGDLFFARKDYRRAIEYFNSALALDPEHAMAFCRRGISHYYRKNYNDALEDLLHAQKLRPDIPNLTTYVAMAQKKKQRKKRP